MEQASFWDRIAADDRLASARRKLSIHEFRMILKHARASWPRDDVPEKLANRMGATFKDATLPQENP